MRSLGTIAAQLRIFSSRIPSRSRCLRPLVPLRPKHVCFASMSWDQFWLGLRPRLENVRKGRRRHDEALRSWLENFENEVLGYILARLTACARKCSKTMSWEQFWLGLRPGLENGRKQEPSWGPGCLKVKNQVKIFAKIL